MEPDEPVVCGNPGCSASLVNQPAVGSCPECGRRYNKNTEMNVDSAHCAKRGCGYNLASLPKWGQCPECGSNYNRLTGENVKRPMNAQEKHHLIIWRITCIGMAIVAGFLFLCTGLLTWAGAWQEAKGMVSCAAFGFLFCAMFAVYAKMNERLHDD